MVYGAFQGALIFFIVLYSIGTVSTSSNGVMEGFFFFGNLVFTLVVLVVTLKLLTSFNVHSWASTLVVAATLAVYYGSYYFLSLIKSSTIYGSFGRLFINISHFAVQFAIVAIILLMDIVMARVRGIMYEYMQVAKGGAQLYIKPAAEKIEPSVSKHNNTNYNK